MNNYKSYSRMFLGMMVLALAVMVHACSDDKNISAPDITSPGVSSTSPANTATGVAVNTTVSVLFNEDINPESLNTETFLVRQGTTPVLGTVAYAGKTVTFTPTANLEHNMLYTATITSVRDLPGNVIASNVVWSFTTGTAPDTTKPAVLSTVPMDAATGVSLNSNLTAIFSEAMDGTTLTTTTVTVRGPGGTPVTGAVTYAGASKSVVFTPAANLAANTAYTATITTAVKDPAGNTLAQNYTWSFTTGAIPDITAPTVTSAVPLNAATNVAITSKLNVTFSEAMDPLTINSATVTLRKGTTAIIGTLTYSGTTTTFTPSAPLDFNATYIAAITTGAKDLAGNALAGNFVWSFSTGGIPDDTRPTVLSTIPVNVATGVAISSKLTAVFSEAMDPLTLSTTTFMVKGPGVTPVTGTVVYDVPSRSAIFTPAGTLAANTLFIATITTGVTDLAGNAPASNFVWSFTTGTTPDITKPTVLSTIPVNAATGVASSSKLTAVFSEAMDPLTLTTATVTLRQGTTPVVGTLTYSGTTVNFTPVVNLASNTLYSAMITTGAKDLAGNALASDFAWSFTTGAAADTTKPTVLSTTPLDAATGVSITSKLTATFSESMDLLTLTTATFTVQGPGETPVTGSIVYAAASKSVTFTPNNSLVSNTLFTATLTTGVKDLAGNALAGNYVWHFTTGATPDITKPTVLSTIPVDAATGVSITSTLNAEFSEAMDPSTITLSTFILRQGTTPVTGELNYSGTTASFKPTGDLLVNTLYTATITTDAKDLAGNALAADYVWSFTTGVASDIIKPTVLSTIPVDAATGVSVTIILNGAFSEAMDPSTITLTTFILQQGTTPVAGEVNYSGTTASFNPTGDLLVSTLYTATITTGAKDLAGNALAADYVWSFTTSAAPVVGQLSVPLGSAGRFAVLSNSAITNIPSSAITGDVGISPGARSSIAGLTAPEVTGTIFAADDADPTPAMLIAAKTDAQIAFDNARAAVRGTPTPVSGNINGLTLVPGLYESGSSIEISPGGFLYLDAGGDVNAVFIIRSATSITTESTSEVVLTGGAQATNIYWTAGSAITLGTNSKMKGTLIAGTSISLLTGSRLDGRALIQGASAGQVSLDQSTIIRP